MRDTTWEVRTNSYAIYFYGRLHMDEQRLDDQLEPMYNSCVLTQDEAWKTFRERWTIETGGEKGPGRSMLVAQHDDDDDDVYQSI